MSGEIVGISFQIKVRDEQRWSPEQREACDNSRSLTPEHYATEMLKREMERAGREHIAKHPEMYDYQFGLV